MYAILAETNETIALKKKQIKENQSEVNEMAYAMANRVEKIQQLNAQVQQLESEVYRLEKQVRSESEAQMSKHLNAQPCAVNNSPVKDY